MQKFGFAIHDKQPPCSGENALYYVLDPGYALYHPDAESAYLGETLPKNGTDIDALKVVETLDATLEVPEAMALIALIRLCLGRHADAEFPGPRAEAVANIFVGAPGAIPFVPILEDDKLAYVPSVREDAALHVEPIFLRTRGSDNANPKHRYARGVSPALAVEGRDDTYCILDSGVDYFVQTALDGQKTVVPHLVTRAVATAIEPKIM